MSLQAILWALNDAPATDPTQVLVLVALAERAGDDGSTAWPSQRTVADRARVSERTVRRVLGALEADGLVRRGDQRYVQHLPADRRPVVWDLAVERVRHRPVIVAPRSGRPPLSAPTQRAALTPASPAAVEPDTPEGHPRPVADDRPDTHDRSSATERGDIGDRNGGTPVAVKTSLETSLNRGAREVTGTHSDAPPPARCSAHTHLETAPACHGCRDARQRRSDWDRARASRPTPIPTTSPCPRHVDQAARSCRRCAQEAAPPPRNLRDLIGAPRLDHEHAGVLVVTR